MPISTYWSRRRGAVFRTLSGRCGNASTGNTTSEFPKAARPDRPSTGRLPCAGLLRGDGQRRSIARMDLVVGEDEQAARFDLTIHARLEAGTGRLDAGIDAERLGVTGDA